MDRELHFYFDYLSHNAYIAWIEVKKLCSEFDIKLRPQPVLFAALLAANKQLGPAEIPPKTEWMVANVIRKAKLLGIPLAPPASHPFNPLPSLRTTLVAIEQQAGIAMIDQLFTACWAESRDISNPQVINDIVEKLGLDQRALNEAINSPTIKQQLHKDTETAIGRGVFGVPTMIIDNRLFWGYDDFNYLRLYLQGQDPFEPSILADWKKVKASAKRNTHHH